MSSSPSQQLAEHLHVTLPADFVAWLDEASPEDQVGAEFDDALSIKRMLDPHPGELWGGFMPPDVLPVLGNRYGDWICLRLGWGGVVRDWTVWRHGGGDWTVIGRSFCEALLYEALLAKNERDPLTNNLAEEPRPSSAAEWALRWLERQGCGPAEPARLFHPDRNTRRQAMLDWSPESTVTYRDIAADLLDCPFRRLATPALAAKLDLPWEPDFLRFTFDTALLPDATASTIRQELRAQRLFEQDWSGAESAALAAGELDPDIGWAHEIAGWAAERRGDRDEAIARYQKAFFCSVFTDESVLFRTHWFSPTFGKFSAERLLALDAAPTDPYAVLLTQGKSQVHHDVADYWMREGARFEQLRQWDAAYASYWKAGWDIGFMPLGQLPHLLDAIAHVAECGENPALAKLARLHGRFVWKG